MKALRNRLFIPLSGLVFLLGITVSGCSKQLSVEEPKKAVAAERERKEKEDGVVTLSQEKQKEFRVVAMKASSEGLSVPISATACIELNADRISKISPRMSGKIVIVNASQGDRVAIDQPLAYLDSPDTDLA